MIRVPYRLARELYLLWEKAGKPDVPFVGVFEDMEFGLWKPGTKVFEEESND